MLLTKIKNRFFPLIIIGLIGLISCKDHQAVNAQQARYDGVKKQPIKSTFTDKIVVGANKTNSYLHYLKDKRVGIVANQTSVIFKGSGVNTAKSKNYTHIVDSLIALQVNLKKVFAPEHGFRGIVDAGELVKDGVDTKTNTQIISLYGTNKKPSLKVLDDIDVMLFDIQDVGARFYTYISTLHYVMEACAELNIPLIILDRPNPNGHYIDGPTLDTAFKSFVGMHPIPVVHGMTIGEYAHMINGESWLENNLNCDIIVIEMDNYSHLKAYSLPIKPSPNLPNDLAINLYPSLCFFEGTNVSAGRGTSKQFQIYGSPFLDPTVYEYSFRPSPNVGAKYPKHNGEVCYGEDLDSSNKMNRINLKFLIEAYANTIDKEKFFNDYFDTLAGTDVLQKQIKEEMSEEEIRSSWQSGLNKFKEVRERYLLYK